MFYVYRIKDIVGHERFMIPAEKCELSPMFPLQAFLKICLNCEWDETWTGVIWQFALPTFGTPLECCAIQERTNGRWFVGSPVPLDYLKQIIDWDAYTDSEELKRTTEALGGVAARKRTVQVRRPWSTNLKGTLVAQIEGCNVCVVKASFDKFGYVGIIYAKVGTSKVSTPTLPTISDAQDYLIKHFWRLTAHWRFHKDDTDDEDGDIILQR